jgi:hypothetical protein
LAAAFPARGRDLEAPPRPPSEAYEPTIARTVHLVSCLPAGSAAGAAVSLGAATGLASVGCQNSSHIDNPSPHHMAAPSTTPSASPRAGARASTSYSLRSPGLSLASVRLRAIDSIWKMYHASVRNGGSWMLPGRKSAVSYREDGTNHSGRARRHLENFCARAAIAGRGSAPRDLRPEERPELGRRTDRCQGAVLIGGHEGPCGAGNGPWPSLCISWASASYFSASCSNPARPIGDVGGEGSVTSGAGHQISENIHHTRTVKRCLRTGTLPITASEPRRGGTKPPHCGRRIRSARSVWNSPR